MAHPFTRRLQSSPGILYALLDTGLVEAGALVDEAQGLVEAGVDLIQLRAKDLEGGALLDLAKAIAPVLEAHGVPLIINDRVDVALCCGADGVHLGQNDLPPAHARRLLGPHAIIGGSTHQLDQVRQLAPELDYFAVGAMFPTETRPNSAVVSPAALTAARAASTLPMFAIGGISPHNIAQLRGFGLCGVAVASAISPLSRRHGAVASLRAALAQW